MVTFGSDERFRFRCFFGDIKRSSRDLQNYRYRSLDERASCFMTSYGRPCEVDPSLLEKGGLYGSLLQQSGCIRKFATPEIIFLQGALDRCWISCNIREAMKILGNSISVPHATWGLLNAVKMIYPDPFSKSIENLFLDIIGDRLHAENFEFSLHDGGYIFSGKAEQIHDDQSDDTQVMMEFACIQVVSPGIWSRVKWGRNTSQQEQVDFQPASAESPGIFLG